MKRTILQLSVSPDFAPIAAAIVTFFLIVLIKIFCKIFACLSFNLVAFNAKHLS